jgi:hypothetical protein
MRLHAANGVAILLALVLASIGVVPCACAEMTATADSSAGHCGPVGPGLRAQVEACTCACIAAQDEEAATPSVATALARSISVLPESHALVPGSYQLVPPIPPRRIGHSPPPSVPSILRI